MKIEHAPGTFEIGNLGGDEYEGLDLHASPHECSVPNCPGDLNRRKLELWDKMLETCIYFKQFLDEYDVNREIHPSLRERVDWVTTVAEVLK